MEGGVTPTLRFLKNLNKHYITRKIRKMKNKIHSFKTRKTGYGHWLVTMVVDNPALKYADDDYYWRYYDRADEPEKLTIKHTTTDSRAIDGHDGYEQALATECLRHNEFDSDDFDMSSLRSEEII